MRPVSQVLSRSKKAGDSETVAALYQPEYVPMPIIMGNAPTYPATCRWTFTQEERAAISAGGDIWITQLTFGNGVTPIRVVAAEPSIEDCMEVEL
jgi:hypothetical protein